MSRHVDTKNAKYQNDKGIRIKIMTALAARPPWYSTECAVNYQKNKGQTAEPKELETTLTAGLNRVTQSEPRARQVKKGGDGMVNRRMVKKGQKRGYKQGGRKLETVVTLE
jgi:hypothetical protein